MLNKSVLMSDATNFDSYEAINPYYKSGSVNSLLASTEHEQVQEMLESIGVNVIQVPSPLGCQDGVYTANWALVRGDKAILSSLPSARCNEQPYAEKILSHLGKKIMHLPEGFKFSGQGDALACGDLLFCGSGYRSDEKAQDFAASQLGYKRIQLQTIPQTDKSGKAVINKSTGWPDSYFYDLDLALAIIKAPHGKTKGLIAYCPEAFTIDSQKMLKDLDEVEKIKVTLNEAKKGFATNLVSNGDSVIMSDRAPLMKRELEKRGLKVLTLKIRELAKGGGFIRCITLTLD